MCFSWCLQPRRETKAARIMEEPNVKHMANLEGANMMTGRNRVNARIRKNTPLPRSAAK